MISGGFGNFRDVFRRGAASVRVGARVERLFFADPLSERDGNMHGQRHLSLRDSKLGCDFLFHLLPAKRNVNANILRVLRIFRRRRCALAR